MRNGKVLAVALAMPLLIMLFIYGAALQPARFWWPGLTAQCFDGPPIKAHVMLIDYMNVPFTQVRFYSPDGKLVASGDTGPGGMCPIRGLEPGRYVVVAIGSRHMFVDYVDVPDVPHKVWSKSFLAMDPRYTTLINYGLLSGRAKVGNLELEVPPLTALHVHASSDYSFEEGAVSLRWLLEPFSGVFWNPLMWRAALSRDLLLAALLTVAVYPLAFSWRRKYAAVLLALFLLGPLGPWTQVGEAQAIGIEIQEPRLIGVFRNYGCDPSLCRLVEFNTNLPPPYYLRIVMDVGERYGELIWSVRVTLTYTKFILWYYSPDPSFQPPLAVFNTTVTIEVQPLSDPPYLYPIVFIIAGGDLIDVETGLYYDDWELTLGLGDLPFQRTFRTTVATVAGFWPAEYFGIGEHTSYTSVIAGVSGAATMLVFYTFGFPTATDRTAVSLVTKYSMRTGFGKDNPINYSIPKMPPGVEQKIVGLELLPEVMFSRRYSVHLLPDWAERGEIARAIRAVYYWQPGDIIPLRILFPFITGPQEWVEPPSLKILDPNVVTIEGKIKSGYLPFPTIRIPFPFAPYYEFPTVAEVPIDSTKVNYRTRWLENATFNMKMEMDIGNQIFLDPPWFEEGDGGDFNYVIQFALCSIPFVATIARRIYAYFKHASDTIDDLASQHGTSTPPGVRSNFESTVQSGVREAMADEVSAARIELKNIRFPTESEMEGLSERAKYVINQLRELISSSRRTDHILAKIYEKYPELREENIFRRFLDKIFENSRYLRERNPVGSAEHKTGVYLANLYARLATGKFKNIEDAIEDVLQTSVKNDLINAATEADKLTVIQAAYDFLLYTKMSVEGLMSFVKTTSRKAFYEYVTEVHQSLKTLLAELSLDQVVRQKISVAGLEPKVSFQWLGTVTLEIVTDLVSIVKTTVATALAAVCYILPVAGAITNWAHATIGGQEWEDPTGVAMAGAIILKLNTPRGIRLAYITVAQKIGFGIFGVPLPGLPMQTPESIVDSFISRISSDQGYGPPIKLTVFEGKDAIEIVGKLNTFTWADLDSLIVEHVNEPLGSITLIGIGFLPVYIPYVNAGAHRFGKTYIFDISSRGRGGPVVNIGHVFELVAVLSRTRIDDPQTMLHLLNPISVNGIIVPAEYWQIIDTYIRDPRYPWPIPAIRPWLIYGFDVRRGEPPESLFIEAKNPNPFSGIFRLNVTHEFLWDPTTSQGGFGVPCLAGEKFFRGLFQVINVRFYRYPVFGSSPPDSVIFTLRAENATVEKVYGSDLMVFTKGSFKIPGSAFIWTKVDEDTAAGITYWDGELKRGVQLPVFSLLVGCGYGFDVSFGDRDATRGNIKGSVDLVSATVTTPRGYAELPTEALFKVEAYRPPSQPNAPRITAEMTVGYYAETDPKGGPKWIEFRQNVRDVTSFPADFRMPIGDLVMKAIDFASKTGKPVVVRASMRLYNEPPGYTVIQPSPKEWTAQPDPPVPLAMTWNLTVLVLDEATDLPIAGALVTVENTTHTFYARTDASGMAAFRLTTGSYSVRAMAEGYRPSNEVHINLVDNAEVVLRLVKAPAQNATVTVYVYDGHTSAPVPGASVSLDSRTGSTGADGFVVFHDVPFGSYLLEVTHPDYAPHSRSVAIANETVRIDVPLLHKRPVTTATVTVLDAVTSSPIQGATVQFENGTMVYAGTTGPDGVARIDLPMGGYTLRASASGYYPFAQTVFVPPTGFSTTVRLAPTTIEPEPPKPPTPPEACDIPLTTIEVIDATNGAGIPGARVTLVRGGFTYWGTTDSNGEAKFCITSGIYSFRAEKEGYQTTEGSAFIVKGTTFTIAMTPLSAIPTGRLKVLVIDAANLASIAGAEVSVRNSTHILTKYTDASGRTEFLLVAGGYTITARKSGYLDFSAKLDFSGGDVNYTISLTPHGMCEYPGNWTEPTPCGYRWLVVSVGYRDGFPFAGAQVTVSNSTMSRTRVTDGTGSVKFLLDPGNYTVTVSATFNSTTWTTSFEVNLNQNLWIVVLTPWYSPYFRPEVRVVYVSFVGPRIGIWGYDHLIAAGFWSNIPQTITARIAAINYTRYANDGTIQILAEKIITLDFRDSAFNETLVALNINGTGFALVAPMATILSYQNDTFTGNNELIGPPIPFGPLIDISALLLVEVDSAPTGALVPEITRMRVTVVFWSTVDLDVPGRLMLKTHYHSIREWRLIERWLLNESFVPRVVAQNRSVTFYLDWTNVTVVSVFVKHDLEINELDNNQTAYIYLDRAIKLVQVRVPPLVRSNSYFNITVTVLSNRWPSFEYSYLIQLGGTSSTGFFRAGYGHTNVTLTVRAPQVTGWAPRTMEMNVTVGPDFAPDDNSMKVLVTVVPEQAVPWILLLLGLLVVGVGGIAISRAARRAQAIYRRRRALRPAGGEEAISWPEAWWNVIEKPEKGHKRRRRALR